MTRPRSSRTLLVLGALLAATPAIASPAEAAGYTEHFGLERCHFVPNGRQNPYFSLQPGDRLTLSGEDDGEEVTVEITVESETKEISFEAPDGSTLHLQARVVTEREWEGGELIEVSRNWFSRCRETQDVFYFGEDVDIYEDGVVVSHDGAWEAGVDGALPGIIIPARFLLGSRYFQEIARDVALDRGENVAMGLTVRAAGRTFEDCVRVRETSPLDAPGHVSIKVYCPNVGLVQDNSVKLKSFRRD